MATRKRSPQTLVLDSTQLEEADTLTTLDYHDEVQASLCPSCGELLAWHEVACSIPATASPQALATEPPAEAEQGLASAGFAYALGQLVQPAPGAPVRPIIWRGQLKARHPRTRLVQRLNVYRLDNGYWDCYYEAELRAA
ncbi:hypothetical protein [Hymenobacter wooponensis]|uniref:Uncharacterized protein n=1 Tax=Hymenobacter wooponensis TaxID=1525360 RepID=A0A4Z0MEA1_9BACT|nr:hypothetical protein [Hymenobacter wooponensis]TGD77618.1 hypothetical protein EU557_22855 [Hymenobacter wooponensis]